MAPEPGQPGAKCDQLAILMHRLFIIAGRTPSPLGAPSVEMIVNDTSSGCTPSSQGIVTVRGRRLYQAGGILSR